MEGEGNNAAAFDFVVRTVLVLNSLMNLFIKLPTVFEKRDGDICKLFLHYYFG